MSALTLLALLGLGPRDSWAGATRKSLRVTKGIMEFVRTRLRRNYAPNTRETFRRQVLHQFVQAGIADYNPDNPGLPTNSPNAHYAISDSALEAVRAFGSGEWDKAVNEFRARSGALLEVYRNRRSRRLVPVRLPDGRKFLLSPGAHNRVQAAVVEQFAPRFAPSATLLYMGDTAKKDLVVERLALEAVGIFLTEHDKLPDLVLHDVAKGWIFLVEVVTSHGPVSPKRLMELSEMLERCPLGKVFVSAFPDFACFRKHMRNIAWETEVWIAETPDHLIHYNGDRFLGPRI
jgi:type II restriction enzyme